MRDQQMLRMMRAAESRELGPLASEIISSESSAQVFEYFADDSAKQILLPLMTEIHAQLRQRDGVAADLKRSEGVFSPWRIARNALEWKIVESWLIEELLKCVPGYLRLLNSIYYFWLATEQHTQTQREPARAAVLEKCKREFSRQDDSVVCGSFDPTFPWILFHLVFTTDYQTQNAVPYGTSEDWAWFAPILLRASNTCPSVLLPQIIILANAWEIRAREVIAYRFNDELLTTWFGQDGNRVIRLVADLDLGMLPELESNALGYLKAAKDEANRRLATT